MAKKIVSIVGPFERKQRIFVYENGNKLEAIEVALNDIYSTIFDFVDQYNITTVSFIGPKQFIKGIVKRLKKYELNRYDKNFLIIEEGKK